MIKKSLLLTLLLALLVPWAANAQATLPIGDGTSYATSGSSAGQTLGSPFGNTWYYNSTAQIIYTASELDGAKTINSLAFYHNANSFSATVKIYLAHTTSSTIDPDSPATDGTLVYTGTGISLGGSSAGWQTFTFDTNFEYNGTDNLLVVVCRTKYNSGYSQSQGWQYTATTNNMCMSRCSDTDAYGLITNTSYSYTATTNRPNVIIGYVPTTPYISLDPTSETVLVGLSKTITATYGNVSGTPTITYSSSNPKIASVSGSGTSATVTGESVGTATITATMTYNATDYTATCAVTVEEPSYCKPSFSNTSDYIKSFTTTGGEQNINNTNTGQGTGGYSNFYDTHFVSAEPDTEIGFSVVRGYDDNYNYAIWVDWNKDYEFDNTTEKVAYTTSSTGDWTGSFTIPAATAAGDYHMRVLQVYSSAATPCVSASYGEGEDYKLTVIAASPYQKPVNLQVTNLTATTATITWEAPNSDVQSYKYQYREAGGSWSALTSTTALSAPLTVLTGNTTYEFQVQAIYAGNNESAFASTSFTTPCDAFSIDPTAYQYGFETADDMDCWELVNGVTNTAVWDNATIEYNFGYEPARTGDYCFMFFYVDYDDTDPEYQTLISPQLTDLPANGVHVEFYYVGDLGGGGQETFRVGYSTTDKNLSSFTWGTEITDASTAYQRFSANYPQGTKYVAVQHTSDDQYYLFLDDFTFEGAADCLEPSSVLADNITTTGASINWTAGGEEVAWDIYVTDDATIVPDDGTTPTYANISTKPYPLPGLTPATTYYVYVRAACKGTETSAWSTPAIFHTECEGMDLPYGPYGFEDGTLSVCWNVINTNTSYNSVSVSASNANLGTHCLSFFRGAATGDLVAVLPEVGAYDLSDYQFEFSAKGSYAGYEIYIGIMTDPDDLTTFVAQGDVITTTTSYAEHKVRFNGYTGSGKYVAIKVVRPSSVTYGTIYVDDIAINPIPSCLEPTALNVTAPTAHGATFAWTAGGSETEWHLYFGKNATAPADDINLKEVTVADSNPFTLTTGLDAETNYYAWVRANCGGTDGYSMWVGPETFTTAVACPAPTGLAASEITGHTAKLSWTGTSESYVLSVGTYDYTATPVMGTILEEGFESWATGTVPTGWTHLGEGTISVQAPSATHVHGGSKVFRFNGTTSDNIAVLPYYGVETNQLTIDFWMKAEGSSSGTFEYGYVTNPSDATTFVKLGDYSASTSTTYQHVENLSMASAPNGARIAFVHKSGSSSWYWFIDDLTINGPTYPIAWDTYNTTDTQKTVEGLDPETQYFAKVKGNCGSEGYSQETAVISFTTDIACPAPTGLTYANLKSNKVDLSWTNGGAENWVVAYKLSTDTDFTEVPVATADVTISGTTVTYTLTGLTPEKEYNVKVQDNCEASISGDGTSDFSNTITFETLEACAQPTGVTVDNIGHYSADLTWTGDSPEFIVKYRTAAFNDGSMLLENFNSLTTAGTIPTNWNNDEGTTTSTNYKWCHNDKTSGNGNPNGTSHDGSNCVVFNSYMNGDGNTNFLKTPSMDFPTGKTMQLTFWWKNPTGGDFSVYISTDGGTTKTPLKEGMTGQSTWKQEAINLTDYIGASNVTIHFKGTSNYGSGDAYIYLDDVIIGEVLEADSWQTLSPNPTTSSASLTGLTIGTKYDVTVAPSCDATLVSDVATFTTLADKIFITEGAWGTATNWMDDLMPTISDNVIIRANATIENGTVAEAAKITFEGSPTPTLTINDGGQLQTNNTVTATVKKSINAYPAEGKAGYYLIGNPLSSTAYVYQTDNTYNIRKGTYDLYSWSYSSDLEWTNYGATNTSTLYMYNGTGYLYANAANTTLTFTGNVKANNTDETKNLNYASSGTYEFNGWNLVGNPFVCDAYIKDASSTEIAFYRMNTAGNGFEAATGAIKPMEGIFVQATATSQSFKFSRTAPAKSTGNLNINVAQVVTSRDAHRSTDNAIIRFGEGNTLEKFSFNDAKTMVYIPQEGKDYAVVSAEVQGEMPVNFKAAENGTYTLSFSSENTEFSYLHLIDNMTGNDVDLLETPSYTFDARYTDYASRFKLVFATGNSNTSDNFGFISNGNLMILGIEGEATLQVIDVTGRVLSTETFSGSYNKAINASAGVYMIRLIQGNDVRTQKIVVK